MKRRFLFFLCLIVILFSYQLQSAEAKLVNVNSSIYQAEFLQFSKVVQNFKLQKSKNEVQIEGYPNMTIYKIRTRDGILLYTVK